MTQNLNGPFRVLPPKIMSSKELSSLDLRLILEFTIALARKAGDLILQGSEAIASSRNVDEKKNSVDLVTEYDVRVEELVKEEIKKTYPDFGLWVHAIMDITSAYGLVASEKSRILRELDLR
jgi:hypothetical protein